MKGLNIQGDLFVLILRINTDQIAVVNFNHAIIFFEVEYSYSENDEKWRNIKFREDFSELFNFLRKDEIDVEIIKMHTRGVR